MGVHRRWSEAKNGRCQWEASWFWMRKSSKMCCSLRYDVMGLWCCCPLMICLWNKGAVILFAVFTQGLSWHPKLQPVATITTWSFQIEHQSCPQFQSDNWEAFFLQFFEIFVAVQKCQFSILNCWWRGRPFSSSKRSGFILWSFIASLWTSPWELWASWVFYGAVGQWSTSLLLGSLEHLESKQLSLHSKNVYFFVGEMICSDWTDFLRFVSQLVAFGIAEVW